MTTPTPSRRQQRRRPTRSGQTRSQGQRRVGSTRRKQREMIDYAGDYAAITRDLKYIGFWTVLLFGLMFGAAFFV